MCSADQTVAVRQGDVKDTLKDAGSTIKDKVSGAADDAEDAAKSGSAYLAHLRLRGAAHPTAGPTSLRAVFRVCSSDGLVDSHAFTRRQQGPERS